MPPPQKEQDIVVQIVINFDGLDVELNSLTKFVKKVCGRFNISKATVSIAIVGDAEIRRLNKQFLSRNSTTDCLSFDLSDDRSPKRRSDQCPKTKLFELIVNGEMAVKEANDRGHSSEAEVALYITHGLLHNSDTVWYIIRTQERKSIRTIRFTLCKLYVNVIERDLIEYWLGSINDLSFRRRRVIFLR
jgi:probable rRNA maturation factor